MLQNTSIIKVGGGLIAAGGTGGAGIYAWKMGLLDSIFGTDQTSLIVSVAKEANTSGFKNGKHKCRITDSTNKTLFNCDLSLLTGKYQKSVGEFAASSIAADETSLSVATNNFQLKVDKSWDDEIKIAGTPTTIDLVSSDGQTKYAVLTPKIKTTGKYIETSEGLMLLIKKKAITDNNKVDDINNYKLNINDGEKTNVKLFTFIKKPKNLEDIKSNNFLFIPEEVKDKEILKSHDYFLVSLKDIKPEAVTKIEYKTSTNDKESITFSHVSTNTSDFFEKYATKEQFFKDQNNYIVTTSTELTISDASTCTYKNNDVSKKSIYCSIHTLSVDTTSKIIGSTKLSEESTKAKDKLSANDFYKLNIYLPEKETINFDTSKIQIDDQTTNLLTIVADIKEKKSNNKHILVTSTKVATTSETIGDSDTKCKLVDNTEIKCKVYKLKTETTDTSSISFETTTKISDTNQTAANNFYFVDFSEIFNDNKSKLTNTNLATITLLKNGSTDTTKQSTLAFKSSVAGTFDSATHSNNKIFYFL